MLRLQNPGGDNQALDFAGAFVDFGDAGVTVIALDGIFAAVTIAAMNLDGFVCYARGHFAGEELGDGRVHGEPRAGVLLPRGLANQHSRSVNFGGHVGENELYGLKLRNRVAKGHAFLGIFERRLESALRGAGSLRGDADAPVVQRRERYFVAFPFVADAIRGRNNAIGENQLAARRGADAEFFFFLADLESRRAFFHNQRGDSFFAFRRFRVHVDDRGIRRAAIGDPGFRTVEQVSLALFDGFRLQRGGVRTGLRLSQRVATDLFTAGIRQQEFFLLFFRPEAMNGIAVKRILHGKNHAGRSAAARNLLDHDGVSDVVEAGAAFRFGKRNACKPQFRGFLEKVAGKMPRLVKLFRQGTNFRFRELAYALLQQFLFFRQFRLHRDPLPSP